MKVFGKIVTFLTTAFFLGGALAGCSATVSPDNNEPQIDNSSSESGIDNSGEHNNNSGNENNGGNITVPDNNISVAITYSPDNDITVSKTQIGNILSFTAEECSLYVWSFNNTEISTSQSYSINLSSLPKGTYSLSLEALKNNKMYSYYAQIIVK